MLRLAVHALLTTSACHSTPALPKYEASPRSSEARAPAPALQQQDPSAPASPRGDATSILDLARTMVALTGVPSEIAFGDFRAGEVRRSVADIGRARAELGYEPQHDLAHGLRELWQARQGQ